MALEEDCFLSPPLPATVSPPDASAATVALFLRLLLLRSPTSLVVCVLVASTPPMFADCRSGGGTSLFSPWLVTRQGVKYRWRIIVILGLWLTLMLERRLQLRGSYTIQAETTR
uniref:Uncharacterized protein n=1 Tax=Opuntia streptacantha TaxID=393608 RepID=A0A7C8ZGW2_OPUST